MNSSSTETILPREDIFKGMTAGSARVLAKSDLEIKGMICGDLIVEPGSRVLVSGMVDGKVIHDDADVTITGMTG